MNERSDPEGDPMTPNPLHKRIVSISIGLFLPLFLGLLVYSFYVAVHTPDRQETILLGQAKLASGTPAAFRVYVRDHVSGKPPQKASVALKLLSQTGGSTDLGIFHTDARGSLSDGVTIPEIAPGEYQLQIDVTSPLGRDHIVRTVEVHHPHRLLLSTDKPIYQPGQTIHLRSLVLNKHTQKPFASNTVTFEVSDPKGNKVFKETRQTSAFGIASADFVLASELNLGRYEVRALTAAASTERTVEVKRYVLPKFKLDLATSQSYYLPGQTVSGSIQASYFFGKPVGNATVHLTATTFQEKAATIAEMQGKTDPSGQYSFQFVLPNTFTGMPQKSEQAFLDITAEVQDTAQHSESKTLSLPVARNELELTAIPEASVLLPGFENILYVLTAYPDGRPAVCKIIVNGTTYQSDEQGVCAVKIIPVRAYQAIDLQAIDSAGRKASQTFRPESRDAIPPLVFRTDKAVYQAGQSAQLTLLSREKDQTLFIDVIKEGQTVLTKSVPLSGQKADYSLPLPSSLVGALKVNAYLITNKGEERGCSRLIYVNPASALQITTKTSSPVYRPGEVARLDFTTTDRDGQPAPAALGVAAVDESVFALHENRPGLLQQFLAAEGDLLKPGPQLNFFASPARFLLDTKGNQMLAQAYFSSLQQATSGSGAAHLIHADYVPAKLLDRVRAMRGTAEYESLRQDPQYAPVFRLLEGEGGTYDLREATGPTKLQALASYRKAYFNNLAKWGQVGFCGLLFLFPVCMLVYYSRPSASLQNPTDGTTRYVELASSSFNTLAALTISPLFIYPLGFVALESQFLQVSPWWLLGFEATVVAGAIFSQLYGITKAHVGRLASELALLSASLWAFLFQYVVSRLGFASMARHHEFSETLGWLWFLGTMAAPLVVLAGLNLQIRRQFAAQGITAKIARVTFWQALALLAILVVLIGLLLPALAKAKAKAQRVTLLSDLKQIDLANRMAQEDGANVNIGGGNSNTPRVRRDFPETLCWRPELITDDQGRATLEMPLADSITTWRVSIEAINGAGKMGSTEIPLSVFQDFFVDLDLPVSMTLGDEVAVPVTCYNYLKEAQAIRLTLAPGNWFETPAQTWSVQLGPNEVKSVPFPIKVLQVGHHSLRVTAQGSKLADAIEREIRVLPTGQLVEDTRNEVLKTDVAVNFAIPTEAIPGSESLLLKFYPSRFSEIVEGLDSIFAAPYGCFEQTSSTTYPNVLVLDYLQRLGKLTPAMESKARNYINTGYQRLLTFEVTGGGFEWFGHTPAHIGLTAYGILEFTDMSRVHAVDKALVERTVNWLLAQQKADGSWSQSGGLHNWADKAPVTAYAAWALAESGNRSSHLEKALNYLRSHPKEVSTTYGKALAANAALARDRNDAFGRQLVDQFKDSALLGLDKTIHWTSPGCSITYSHGSGMDVETTALVLMAMMKSGLGPQSIKQGLAWLSTQKTSAGTWGSTQATILAMRALLQGTGTALGQDFASTVTVSLNGKKVESFRLNKENSDVMKQLDLTRHVIRGENRLELHQSPAGELAYQLTGIHWLPTPSKGALNSQKPAPLQIDLQYDRTTLRVNDQLKCTVSVRNNTGQPIQMAIVDLGIPPGFDVDATAIETLRQHGKIAKVEMTGNQVILYLRELSAPAPFQFVYSLRAKYPLHIQTPRSSVYEYYHPINRAESKSTILQAVGD